MSTLAAPYCHPVEPLAPDFGDCSFYHTLDLPQGEVRGQWDLRPAPEVYLGNVPLSGRSVVEVGPASGFLSFYMESAGATVTCLEPTMSHLWDVVPMATYDVQAWRNGFADHIRQIRNSFWYCHRLHESRIRMFVVDPYNIADAVGSHQIGILASVLLHTRSPVTLIESLARRVTETVVIAECHYPTLGTDSVCKFTPTPDILNFDTWWQFTPEFFVAVLRLLGFPHSRITYHLQKCELRPEPVPMFTVVASR